MSKMETHELRLRWTVDTLGIPNPETPIRSSDIRFKGGEWTLAYRYDQNVGQHRLILIYTALCKSFPSFVVSVHLESRATERIILGLSRKTSGCTETGAKRFTSGKGKGYYWHIWRRSVLHIEHWDPEFRRDGLLRFLCVITERDDNVMMRAVREIATQTEDIGEPRPIPSTSVQNEDLFQKVVAGSSGTDSTSLQTILLQDCLASLSQDLSKLLDQESDITDVEFQCGGQSTRAHGAIVSVRSEVIASMLTSDMVEGRTRVIKIPNMDPGVFHHFLRYMYTGSLPELTVELALNLYESGDQYAVLGLARRCSQYLLEHLPLNNACDVLVVADAHGNAELKEAAVEFMLVNSVPWVSDQWKDFCSGHPMLAIEVLNRALHI